MKTVRVVAAVIRKDDKFLPHKEDMENSRTDGNFLEVRLRREKHLNRHLSEKLKKSWIPISE